MMRFGYDGWRDFGCSRGFFGSSNWMGWMVGGFAMMIGLIVLVALIVILLNWARNGRIQAAPPGFGRHSNSEALRILNERYARGEISDDDYRRMKNELLKQEVVR